MPSLLGQFYSRIKGSQEDIASESLTYILQKSLNACQALDSLVLYDSGIVVSDLTYRTQLVGENKERPDISGFDDSGIEKVILEAKFWSALTANQPVEYLNRMPENSVLIFICPALRTRSIFSEVMIRHRRIFPFQTGASDGFWLYGTHDFRSQLQLGFRI
ncbi:MAG: hypothetical protein ACKO6M_02020 [Bacteroidota bacterium]